MKRLYTEHRIVALAATLAAYGVWLAALSTRSLWADEFATNRIMEQPDFWSMLAYTPLSERRPPLYYITLWGWQSIAGHGEFSLRYLSLWWATLAVPAFYALARIVQRWFRLPATRWTAAIPLLLALSPATALFGVMIRNFALVLALAMLFNLAFARWMALNTAEGPAQPRAERNAMLAWLVAGLALVFSEYGALALIGAHVLWVLLHPRLRAQVWRPLLVGLVVLALAFLALVPGLLEQVERGKLDADLSRDLIGFVLRLATPLFAFPFGETILPWHPLVLIAAPFVAWAAIRAIWVRETRGLALFCLLVFAAPLAFNTFILTTIATDLTFLAMPSRTLYAMPPLLMVIAFGAGTLRPVWRRLSWVAVAAANVAALTNLGLGIEYLNPIYAVPLREIHQYLQSHTRSGDLLISDLDIVYQYYYDRAPIAGTQLILTEDANLPSLNVQIAARTPPRIWLFVFGRDRSSAGDRVPALLQQLDGRYRAIDELRYAPTDPLYRDVKQRLIPRAAYDYKLIIRLYERLP
ncbi:MAG: hypothetical protein HZB53_08835 [Chloroflexi bacterium]|nr:hypothetical protein [Chloroflexota bacterium]